MISVSSNLATEWKSKEGSRSSGCNEAGTDPDLCLGKGDHGHEGGDEHHEGGDEHHGGGDEHHGGGDDSESRNQFSGG